jgi:hypothetical protein
MSYQYFAIRYYSPIAPIPNHGRIRCPRLMECDVFELRKQSSSLEILASRSTAQKEDKVKGTKGQRHKVFVSFEKI